MSQETKYKKEGIDTKKMLKEAGKANRRIKFNDRVEIEITSDKMNHFKKGEKVKVHRVVAEQYIKDNVAKEVK